MESYTRSEEVRNYEQQLGTIISKSWNPSLLILVKRRTIIYTPGYNDGYVYFIAEGRVKVSHTTASGKSFLLSICEKNQIFGETCLTHSRRMCSETATAMKNTKVWRMSSSKFIALLEQEGLLKHLMKYIADKLIEQQAIATDLATLKSDCRLAATLIRLSRKVQDSDNYNRHIEDWISCQELSEMVGTTRSRVGYFMKNFKNSGAVRLAGKGHLQINESALVNYIELRE